jgi:putative ABC transport system permease protein
MVRTYPDKGHGSFTALAPPPETRLVTLPQLSGRWLSEADERGVVLNHVAARVSGLSTGDATLLSFDGPRAEFRVVGVVEEVGSAGVVYLLPRTFASVLGTDDRSRVARVATSASTPEERSNVIRRIELELARHAIGVEVAIPFSELRTAVGDHVIVLVRSLLALALILASVGLLGLGSAMGVSVLERTRELGVLKALGATRARIRRSILGEALFTALVSFVLAVLVSLPLTLLVGTVIGKLGFLAPLPFVLAPVGIVLWGAVSVVGALIATLGPAQRATAMTVRDALVEL